MTRKLFLSLVLGILLSGFLPKSETSVPEVKTKKPRVVSATISQYSSYITFKSLEGDVTIPQGSWYVNNG